MIRFYRPILLKAGEFKGWFKKYRNDLIDKYIQSDEVNTVFTTPN